MFFLVIGSDGAMTVLSVYARGNWINHIVITEGNQTQRCCDSVCLQQLDSEIASLMVGGWRPSSAEDDVSAETRGV